MTVNANQAPPRDGVAAHGWLELRFAGIPRSVLLPDSPDLLVALTGILNGWTCQTRALARPEDLSGRALAGLFPKPAKPATYDLVSAHLDEPLRNLPRASALCGIVADLSQAYADAAQDGLALHCGAFLIRDRLVALTGPHRAGKSTLIARLTAEPGLTVFCDDVLPVTPGGEGLALGVAPRLRLPVPATASPEFRAHVDAHLGLRDDRYGYLCAPGIAPHGARAGLSAFVVLDRRDAAPARLHRLDAGEALHHLLSRNIAAPGSPEVALDRVAGIVRRAPCLKLVYSDMDQAVALLRRAFGGAAPLDPAVPIEPALPFQPETAERPSPVDPFTAWRRARGTALRNIAGSVFLWRPGEDTFWHLNEIARAVWALLATPGSASELAATLGEVFPDIPRDRLTGDVARLLARMAENGLIEASRT